MTGQQHAGDFIDLLGDGRVRARRGDEPLFDLDLTYKVQVEPGGIAQVVGMARDFARGEQARRLPRRQHLRVRAGGRDRARGTTGALVFVEGGARPRELRRRRLRRRRAASPTSSRRPASSTRATTRRRRTTRSSASTATRRTCSRSSTRSSRRAAASSRSRTSTASTRGAASSTVARVEGWWHDGGKHWADLADVGRLIEETGREQVIVDALPAHAARGRARLVHGARARERAAEADPAGEPRRARARA